MNECCLPLKVELLGLCGENLSMTKRIKYLQTLFQKPLEEIVRLIMKDEIKNDPILFAGVLMGLNNRI